MDDETLITGLLAGDEAAFRYAVAAYHNLMHHVARAIIGSEFAEEIVQDAWLSVIRALPQFERRSSLKTWILQIVSNLAKSRLRRERRSIAVGDAADLAFAVSDISFQPDGHWAEWPGQWHHDTPELLLASVQLQSVIETALAALPELQRTVLTLRDVEGLEMEEICNMLELSESNSRVLLHRARLRLWQSIDKFQRGEVG
ncbi:MAG: sigma-70 family RNA polymerase sigma factor [Pseudomonadota bacterium]